MSRTPEFRVIDAFRERFADSAADVVVGIGDDAAVTTLSADHELLIATDALVAGTHFDVSASAASVGHRCLAVNLSDLAAMGATPRWATLALTLPTVNENWVAAFVDGFGVLAAEHELTLIGGDTVRGPLAVSVTVLGSAPVGTAVQRCGATSGEGIYLTGAAGEAAVGCQLALGQLQLSPAEQNYYRRRFEFPQPRVQAGLQLRAFASAMIDVSDGVHTDLGRLLAASGVGGDAIVPPLEGLTETMGADSARDLFLTGGEDYELLFTSPDSRLADIQAVSDQQQLAITRIGTVCSDSGLRWTQAGKPLAAIAPAFEHFYE